MRSVIKKFLSCTLVLCLIFGFCNSGLVEASSSHRFYYSDTYDWTAE